MVRAMMVLGGVMMATSALAGDETPEPKVIYQAVTEIEMEKLDVDGTLVRPGLTLSIERTRASFPSFIKLRDQWTAEMKRSVNDVK